MLCWPPVDVQNSSMPLFSAISKVMISGAKPAWTQMNEIVLGVHTMPLISGEAVQNPARAWWRGEPSKHARHDDNCHYATIDYWNVRRVLRFLDLKDTDVFVDIGCGMGRIVCMAARLPLRKCIGIELSESLCAIARRNASNLRGRRSPVEIRCCDAATADVVDGTVYFMFNPFGPETLGDTLENIRRSVCEQPRPIRIVYYNAVHESLLESMRWLKRGCGLKSIGGLAVGVWSTANPVASQRY